MATALSKARLLEVCDGRVEPIAAEQGFVEVTDIERLSTAVDDAADRVLWKGAQDESLRKIWDNEHDAHWDSV